MLHLRRPKCSEVCRLLLLGKMGCARTHTYTRANTHTHTRVESTGKLVPVGQVNLNHWTSNPTDLVYKKLCSVCTTKMTDQDQLFGSTTRLRDSRI